MADNRHVQHIRSSVVENGKAKLPSSDALYYGEIAINYAKGYETISLKNNSGDVVTFSSDANNSGSYAPKEHTHVSSAITAMTSYSKPSTTSAILTSDTLNQAIGKLEKGVENAIAGGGVSSVSLISGSTDGTFKLSVNMVDSPDVKITGWDGLSKSGHTHTHTAITDWDTATAHTHTHTAITDWDAAVENTVVSSTNVTNRVETIIASAITGSNSVITSINEVISGNASGSVETVISAFTDSKLDGKFAAKDHTHTHTAITDWDTATAHTHVSSAITAMTSYSKPSTTSAILTSDTLNQAIGKLEKGIENAVAGGVSSVSLISGSTDGTFKLSVNGVDGSNVKITGWDDLSKSGHTHTHTAITDWDTATAHTHTHTAITDWDTAIASAVTSNTVVQTLSGKVETISGDVQTLSGSVSGATAMANFLTGHNTSTSLTNIPTSKRLVIATVSSAVNNFSVSGGTSGLADGYELHIIVNNSSASDITIATTGLQTPYKVVGNDITIVAGSYGEINVISDGTTLYVRGA